MASESVPSTQQEAGPVLTADEAAHWIEQYSGERPASRSGSPCCRKMELSHQEPERPPEPPARSTVRAWVSYYVSLMEAGARG